MDNPATESSGDLSPEQAASLFAAALDPVEVEKEKPPEAAAEQEKVEAEPEAPEDDPTVTVKIDGKEVEVKLSELKNGYQRQADYTRKTMETAEQRKAAEAEVSRARQERETYAQNLHKIGAALEVALTEQNKQTNWEELSRSDPAEYVRQLHLAQSRQAQLQQIAAERQRVASQEQAEQQAAFHNHLQSQHQALLDKLPEWRDESKAKAEKVALREYLQNEGFESQLIDNLADARLVVLARKAMLHDQIMSKAQAATKKVATLPTKVERPGVGESPALDRRTAAYNRLGKTGKVEDAAAVFASLL